MMHGAFCFYKVDKVKLMSRRLFLQQSLSLATLAGLGGLSLPLSASLLPVSPFFGLHFDDRQGDAQPMRPYLGKPTVVNFWATWCAPCVEEMPELEAMHQDYPDIQFIGIAIDSSRNVTRFLERIPVTYDLYVAGHGGVKTMRELGNKKGGLPYTLVFNAQGRVHQEILGQIDATALRQTLDPLVLAQANETINVNFVDKPDVLA